MEKRVCFFVIIWILLLPTLALASPYMVVDKPELQSAIILLGDLYGRGESVRIVAHGSSIYIEEKGIKTEIITDISGKVSALAFGDLTGNLKNDLVVGTANAGAIYVYQEQNGEWYRTGQPLYLWDTISKLEVHDLNNDGWGDLVILTGQKEAQVLLSWEGKLYPFWKTGPDQLVVDWQVADINQDGFADLVYILQSGYIGALTWDEQEFTTLWENYPWGQMESLIILEQQSSPEWIAVTSQKMLYGWRWKGDEVVSSRHFHATDLGESLFYIPGQGVLSFSKKTGASLFELKSSSVVEKWRIPNVFATSAIYLDGGYLLGDPNHNYFQLVSGEGKWRIFADHREITDLVEIREFEDHLYFNLQQLGTTLGFTVVKGQSWHLLKDSQYLTIEPETNQIMTAGVTIPNALSFQYWDDALYCTADFLPLMGWLLEIDQARKQILLNPNWGWWFFKD